MSPVRDEAIGQLQARLRNNPGDIAALRALKQRYQDAGDYPSLVNLLRGWSTVAPTQPERVDALYEAGYVLLQNGYGADQAAPYFAQVLQHDPLHAAAIEAYEAAMQDMGRYQELASFLAGHLQTLARLGSPTESRALLSFRLGELWRGRLGNLDEALSWYEHAAELDPTLLRALYEARQICLQRGEISAATQILQREAAAEVDHARRLLLYRELAETYEHDLQDLPGAAMTLGWALEMAPHDLDVAAELSRVLAQQAETAPESDADNLREQAADLQYQIATALPEDVRRDHCVAALALCPGHDPALAMLEADAERGLFRTGDLAVHWVAYLAAKPRGPHHQQRRLMLARAYLDANQLEDAAFCLQEPLRAGVAGSSELAAALTRAQGSATAEDNFRSPHGLAPDAIEPLSTSSVPSALESDDILDLVRPDVGRASGQPPSRESALPEGPLPSTLPPPRRTSAAPTLDAPPPLRTSSERPSALPSTAPPVVSPEADQEGTVVAPPPGTVNLGAMLIAELRDDLHVAVQNRKLAEATTIAWRILDNDPTDKDAFNFLDAHLRRARDHRARCQLLEQTAASTQLPPETRILRLRESAGLRESRLKDVDGAMSLWKQIGKLDPDSDEPIRNLKRLIERMKRWDSLEETLEEELQNAGDDAQRTEVLERLCTLHLEQRSNPRAAASALRRLLAISYSDTTEARLGETLLALGDYPEAAQILRRRAAAAGSNFDRVALLLRLVDVLKDNLNEVDAAYGVCEEILESDPQHREALSRMADIDQVLGRHDRLLKVLDRQRATLSAEDSYTELTLRMAHVVADDLGDETRAVELISNALDAHPNSEALLQSLIATLEKAERFEDLVEVLRERAILETRRGPRSALMRKTAEILERRLNDEAGAMALMEAVLQEGEDIEALAYLEDYARRHGDDERLVDLLARRIKLTKAPEELRVLRLERARRLTEELERHEDAVYELSQVLDQIDPLDPVALALLEPACRAAVRFDVLARIWEKLLDLDIAPSDKRTLAEKLAELYQGPIASKRKALAALKRWSELDRANPEPHRRLQPMLRAQRDHQGLLHTLDALSTLESDPQAQDAAVVGAAKLCAEQFGDPDAAWLRLEEPSRRGLPGATAALEALATQHGRLAEFCTLLQETEQYEALFAVVERAANASDSNEQKVAWLLHAARLHLAANHDEDAAAKQYKRVLLLQENLEAMHFVLDYARADDDAETIADLAGRLASLEADSATRAALHMERAYLLLDRLKRPAEAAQGFGAALQELGEDYEPAAEGLLSALRASGNHTQLSLVLEKRIARGGDAEIQSALAEELAALYLGPLRNPQKALAALRQWQRLAPDRIEPLRILREQLEAPEHVDELLSVLDTLAAREETPDAQVEASLAAARLVRARHGDLRGAFDRLTPWIGDALPDVEEELSSLADLDMDLFEQLCLLLHDAGHEVAFDHQLQRRVDRAVSVEDKLAVHRRIARMLAGPLDRLADAESYYRAIVDLQDDEEALRFLRASSMRGDNPAELADILGRLAQLAESQQARQDLLFEQAHILRARLSKPTQAAEILRTVLTHAPTFGAALDELRLACEQAGDSAGLADCLLRALSLETDPDQRAELGLHLYLVHKDELGDPVKGLPGLRAWSEASPNAPEPLRELAALYDETREASALLQVFDRLAQVETTDIARVQAQFSAGKLCAGLALNDLDGAFARLWPLVLSEHPEASGVLVDVARRHKQLSRLCDEYEAAKRYDELSRLLHELAEDAQDPEERANIYARCAAVLAGPLGDELAAAEAYRQLVELREDLTGLRYLADIARRMDDAEQLTSLLARVAKISDDLQERVEALIERAQLLSQVLEDTAGAVADLLQALALDPKSIEAAEMLIEASSKLGDAVTLASGLQYRLAQQAPSPAMADTARRLVELHKENGKLPNLAKLRHALEIWAQCDPRDPRPHALLEPLLSAASDAQQRLQSLDALMQLSPERSARLEAAFRSAQVCVEPLRDVEGAMRRLAPWFLEHAEPAATLLESIAREHKQFLPLAGLYVQRAQLSTDVDEAGRDWAAAVHVYEKELRQKPQALEAALRMLATNTRNLSHLQEVERLALATRDLDRLGRVYGKLVDDAQGAESRADLCLRAAHVFEAAKEPNVAMEWAHQACVYAPNYEAAVAKADALTENVGNDAERLWLWEQRAARATSPEQRVDCLLQVAHLADIALQDRERANQALLEALPLTIDAPSLADKLWRGARKMDDTHPGPGEQDIRRALVRAHLELARNSEEAVAIQLVLRAARLLSKELNDQPGSYDALRQATTVLPHSQVLLDALHEAATVTRRLDGLDAHLARLAEREGNPSLRRSLLMRRGRLLAEQLGRHDSAARVYGAILERDPDDEEAQRCLMDSLRQAGRFQELLRAIDERLQDSFDEAQRITLMCDRAYVWERDLHNRAKAMAAWNQLLEVDPEHPEARNAIKRLSV